VVNYVVEMIVPNEPLPGAEAAADGSHADAGHEAAPDPEKAWERMKDRMAAQGVTKEQFLKRFQERMGERKAAAAPKPAARPVDAATLARIPGGASQLAGPKFTGSLALRSGMTANVTIVTNQRRDVLRVPNAALRFNPAAFIKDDKKADAPRLGQPMMMGGGPRPGGGAQSGTGSKGGLVAKREDRIWTLENGKPKALVVKAGVSDGQFTEVSGEGIQEGLVVLTGVDNNAKQAAGAAPLGGTPGQGGGRR
jgi:HlyD family secretion protein